MRLEKSEKSTNLD
jgi:dynein heavy chain, axonemal